MEYQNEEKWEQELIHRIDQIEENAKEIKTMTKRDYRIAVVITLLCLVVVVAGCALGKDAEEEMDTGVAKKATLYQNGYSICVSGPENGHPSGDLLWATYYRDEAEKMDVSIDFCSVEGSLSDRKQELEHNSEEVTDGVLWGNKGSYYITEDEYCINADETIMADCLVVLLPLDEKEHLQIEIKGDREPLEDGKLLLENEKFQSAFTLEIAEEE